MTSAEFDTIYCASCKDSRIDPHFGGRCLDCTEESLDEILLFLREVLPDLEGDEPLLRRILRNRISTSELRLSLGHWSRAEKIQKQKSGWRGMLHSTLHMSFAGYKKLQVEILEDAIEDVLSTRRRKLADDRRKTQDDLERLKAQEEELRLKALAREQRRANYIEREKARNLERIEILLNKCQVVPLVTFPGWDVPWRARCLDCSREVFPRFSIVRKSGWACEPCARRRLNAKKAASQNDERSRLMEEIGGVIPLEPYRRSQDPWKCRCKICNSVVSPRFDDVVNKARRACIECSRAEGRDSSFDFNAPGIIYFLEHLDLLALKIGISTTSSKTDRVGQHELNGWQTIKIWNVKSGADARAIEQMVLQWWREDLKLPFGCDPDDMPQGGFTETAPAIGVEHATVTAIVDDLVGQLGTLTSQQLAVDQKFKE